jgi:hypothetical protein
MKIMVFTEGTILMHSSAIGVSRSERVKQVMQKETSVHDYASYIPNGNALKKIRKWINDGAEIFYLTSRRGKDVKLIRDVLEKFGFPSIENLLSRKYLESYADVAVRVMPDILIEDDCESIGGVIEMTHPNIPSQFRDQIKSVIVKEFDGIDRLSDKVSEL